VLLYCESIEVLCYDNPMRRLPRWKPKIEHGSAPVYVRLTDALERDIRGHSLQAGARLPPHRDLAHELGLSVGTVSKAYMEAERRGLISARVGRGSFVLGGPVTPAFNLVSRSAEGLTDLARNVPPVAPVTRRYLEAVARVRHQHDIEASMGYGPPEGLQSVRVAAAEWFRKRQGVERADAADLVQCNGGQQGLALTFGAVCRPGDPVLCEAATFYGARTLAQYAGYKLHGVAMDAEGLEPEALERAVRTTGARVLFTIPTLQNPTSRTMSLARRRAIVEIARAHDLTIIEDDTYNVYADRAHPPQAFAELAPERTYYVGSVSKSLSPGLRLAFVLPPDRAGRERLLRGVRALGYCPPSLGALVFLQWMEDGVAYAISDEIVAEARERTAIAQRVLGTMLARDTPLQTLHVWLPISASHAERAASRALRSGVEVTPPDAPIVSAADISGLRICLGGAPDHLVLEQALQIVASSLQEELDEPSRMVV